MDRPQLSRFVCFCVLMLAINTWVSAQQPKPSYVLKYLPGNEANERDPFLQRIPKNIIEALHNLDEVDVISPYTSSSYPAQYYLELNPSYLHYIWKEGTYHFVGIKPDQWMCFEYRANYSPKVILTLGSIATGQVLSVYELKTMSVLPARGICLKYDEVGYQEGLPLEPADQQKYLQKVLPALRKTLPKVLMPAEEILRKEFNWAVKDVLYHFFPTRNQVIGIKSMSRDSIALDIQGIQALNLRHYQALFVYTLKQFNHSENSYERIEPLESWLLASKREFFRVAFLPKQRKTSRKRSVKTRRCGVLQPN
ncbi:hypothetical protein [Haliscomenobacter sp.]|uniref:hypothetical protein n=1 Tax=Haliscomenobacter sp. TaxID=2717303 RepID=UPI003BA9B15A